MTHPFGVTLAHADAAAWVHRSLDDGSALAQRVRSRIDASWSGFLIAPVVQGAQWRLPLTATGMGWPASEVRPIALQGLERIAACGGRTLVVEDDAARRGDPHLGRVAFVDERVIRWNSLDGATAASLELLQGWAYPLNAFVCRATAAGLGLATGRSLALDDVAAISAATEGVIVSAYDGEGFVALLAPGLVSALE